MDVSTGADSPQSAAPLSPEPRVGAPVRSDAVLENLAARLSHHLRGLVNSIEGYTDLLNDTLGSPEQRELSLRILEGTSRIEGIVADLRRYAQPADPVIRPVMPHRLLGELRALLSADQWAQLHIDFKPTSAYEFWADPILLRQALLVLVQNALEAERKAAARLSLERDESADVVRFSVWNEGVIAIENAESRVFEPFFTTKPSRLGIGLAIAQRIAERHGGGLELTTNTQAAGTTFVLSLPQRAGQRTGLLLTD